MLQPWGQCGKLYAWLRVMMPAQIPRFAFEKFPGSKAELTTQMKSVGEAMAIGRTFQASRFV